MDIFIVKKKMETKLSFYYIERRFLSKSNTYFLMLIWFYKISKWLELCASAS